MRFAASRWRRPCWPCVRAATSRWRRARCPAASVLVYDNLTIPAGVTVTLPAGACGAAIVVRDTLTINGLLNGDGASPTTNAGLRAAGASVDVSDALNFGVAVRDALLRIDWTSASISEARANLIGVHRGGSARAYDGARPLGNGRGAIAEGNAFGGAFFLFADTVAGTGTIRANGGNMVGNGVLPARGVQDNSKRAPSGGGAVVLVRKSGTAPTITVNGGSGRVTGFVENLALVANGSRASAGVILDLRLPDWAEVR